MVHSRKSGESGDEGEGLMGMSAAQGGGGKHKKKGLRRKKTVGLGEPSTSNAILAIVEID